MPQISTVGRGDGFRDDGAIGTQEEPAVFRRNTRVCSVLRDSGPVETKGPEFAAPLAPGKEWPLIRRMVIPGIGFPVAVATEALSEFAARLGEPAEVFRAPSTTSWTGVTDGKTPFVADADCQDFLKTLAEACQKTGWQLHACCFMHNHFHRVPEPSNTNPVACLRWFLRAQFLEFSSCVFRGH